MYQAPDRAEERGGGAGPDPMADPMSDAGVVSLVVAPSGGGERRWNFTVSGSSFPSWAWR